jgi:integrase
VRVQLKGINPVKRKLASGEVVTYYYLGKGGPRLRGEPGTPEFMASYNEAVAAMHKPPQGVIMSILQGYQTSSDFRDLRPRTQADYKKHIKIIERDFGDFPLTALEARKTRGEFMAWRDKLSITSARQAHYSWQVLSLVLSWALDRGLIGKNPCERGGKVYRGSRVDNVFTEDDVAAIKEKAPHHIYLALMMALWTGQRQGDLLRLQWPAYDGQRLTVLQSKTNSPKRDKRPVRVVIPIHQTPLKALLDAEPKRALTILTTEDGEPWKASKDGSFNGFQSSWKKAMKAAGVTGLTFGDLRGTFTTRLAGNKATHSEIRSLTGHVEVGTVLERHYISLNASDDLAESGMDKLVTGTNFSKRTPK